MITLSPMHEIPDSPASYSKDDPIDTTARDFTRQSLVPVSAPSTSPRGLYILPGLSANTFFGTPTGFGTSASPITAVALSQYGPGNQADNSFRVATLPADAFNTLAQGLYSVGPSERYGLYGRYSADVSDTIQLKIEGLYNRRKSDQLFSPVLLDIGGTSGTIRGFSIPNNHQFNPFGSANGVPTANALAFNTNSAWRVRRVMDDVGNRRNVQDVTTVRFAMGLEGQAKFFDRDWNWDLFASASKNSMDSSALNGINYDRLALGLGNTTVCATTAGCVPVNLFAPMSAEAANYIRFTTIESNFNQMTNFAFNVSGDIFTLPAGPVSMAAGLERRTNSAGDTPDAFANTPPSNLPAIYTTTTAQTRTPTRGSYTLNEAYVEFALPLLKDVPLANSLDLSFAARYSDYDTVGDATTIKVGAGWKPIEDVLVRATFSQGFRAPSILELYQGARETSFQGTDPCNGGAAAKPNLPGCVGVPSGYNQANFNLNGLIPGTISGNLNLKPETADTTTFGIAIKPRLVPGLSLTLDWFEITITDAIASQSATQILNLCSVQGGVFCALISRDTGTGAVLRLLQGAQNLNEIKTSGIDTTLRYDFNTGFGRFSAVLDGSYLEEFSSTSPNPTGGPPIVDDRVGKGDAPRSTFPKWKGQASVRWNNDNWNAVWRGRYIGETTDVVNAVKDNKTKAVFYQDAEFGYKFEQYDTTIGIGINNIFDETPPLSYANAPINYDIYTYDARGRVIYAKFGFQF
jgi:iron complex outermembrane receptor protein